MHSFSSPSTNAARCSAIATCLFLIILFLFAGGLPARAADVNGAWATDVRACDKIFQKKGNVLTLANRSDTLGSGFIIDGTEIRGKTANCKIKSNGKTATSSISLRPARAISCCRMSKWH